jgi:iron complex outermembrane receptor protein
MLNCLLICNAPTAFGGFGPLPSSMLANITPFVWNGATPPGFTGPQPGVSTATASNPTGITWNDTTGVGSRLLEAEWDAWTGTAGLEWSPDQDTLVFGKYSRGFKTGAFNATNLAGLPKTDPEQVDAYELGWKQEWSQADLTTNMALFLYDYRDIQVPLTEVLNQGQVGETTITALRNVPKVQTTGFELESVWRPVDDLTLRFTYAWLKPEVKESGIYLNSLVPRNITNTADPAYVNPNQSVEGNVLPQSPENKVAFNASYMFNFEDGSSLMPSLSYYWRDGFASDVFNNPSEITPAFDQTDFRLLWNDADGMFTVIGFVRNLFDEVGYDSVSSSLRTNPNVGTAGCVTGVQCFDPSQPVSSTNVPGVYFQNFTQTQPRTWGVELQVHF